MPDSPLARLFALLEGPLARERLIAYRPPGGADEDALATYLWNAALSEAFYPALQGVEVALRNAVHAAGMDTFGDDALWFDTPAILPLQQRERDMVLAARRALQQHHKAAHGRPTHRRVELWLLGRIVQRALRARPVGAAGARAAGHRFPSRSAPASFAAAPLPAP